MLSYTYANKTSMMISVDVDEVLLESYNHPIKIMYRAMKI